MLFFIEHGTRRVHLAGITALYRQGFVKVGVTACC